MVGSLLQAGLGCGNGQGGPRLRTPGAGDASIGHFGPLTELQLDECTTQLAGDLSGWGLRRPGDDTLLLAVPTIQNQTDLPISDEGAYAAFLARQVGDRLSGPLQFALEGSERPAVETRLVLRPLEGGRCEVRLTLLEPKPAAEPVTSAYAFLPDHEWIAAGPLARASGGAARRRGRPPVPTPEPPPPPPPSPAEPIARPPGEAARPARAAEPAGPDRLREPAARVVAGEVGEVRFTDEWLAERLYVLGQEASVAADGRLEVKVRLVSLDGKRRCEVQMLFLSAAGQIVQAGAVGEWRLREAYPQTIEERSQVAAEKYVMLVTRGGAESTPRPAGEGGPSR